jgi:hypothetical protein
MPDFTPNFPGLATHYAPDGDRGTACGRPAKVVRTAPDWARVNCKGCLRKRPRDPKVILPPPSRVQS